MILENYQRRASGNQELGGGERVGELPAQSVRQRREGGGEEKVRELPTQSVRQGVFDGGVATGAHTERVTR